MSSTGIRIARKVFADALTFTWSAIQIRFAIRCTLGVAIPLIIASLAGAPLSGSSAAFGALVTGLASAQGVYRTRVGVMLLAGATLAISGFVGALTGQHVVLNIALLAVWTLVFGVVASLGRAATIVSINACVAFVLFSNAPYDTANPGVQATMLFLGCALQMLLLVLMWPLSRFGAERSALCTSYTDLAKYAGGLDAGNLGLPETQSVAAVSAALADPQPFGGRGEIAAYQALADEAERLRASLAALNTEQHLLDDLGMSNIAGTIRDVGHAAATLLNDIAAGISAARAPAHSLADVKALETTLKALEGLAPEGAAYLGDARALAGQLRGALRSAVAAANGGLAVDDVAPPHFSGINWRPVRVLFDRLLANCSWNSIYTRHAIRLTVALVIAMTGQHFLQLEHGQWIGLSVILVLRPDFSSTFTRGIARVAGTIGGAIIASLIAIFHPTEAAYMVLAIVFAGMLFALFNVSYALFSLSITGYVVYLLAFGGSAEHSAAFDRVVATALGGSVALLAYAAWPAWSHAHVGDDLAALVDAQRKYVRMVLLAFSDPVVDEKAIRTAQVAAWRARSNAELVVDQMAGEPVKPRALSVRSALGILAATRRFGIACLTLRSRITRISGGSHPTIRQFVDDLDTTLRSIVDGLRTGEVAKGLPPLRNDQLALQRKIDERVDPALAILGSETDLIVDSVNTISAILARTR